MKYLLDTNICIHIIKRHPQSVLKRFQLLKFGDVGISSVTLAELEYGIAKSQRRTQNKGALEQFLIPLEILPFDDLAAEAYGVIRFELEKKGIPIGPLDLMIAAHAYSANLVLVTNNLKEFERIPNLAVENWVSNIL